MSHRYLPIDPAAGQCWHGLDSGRRILLLSPAEPNSSNEAVWNCAMLQGVFNPDTNRFDYKPRGDFNTISEYQLSHFAPGLDYDNEGQLVEADHLLPKPGVDRETFLAEIRQHEDPETYAMIEALYDASYGHRPRTHLVSDYDGVDA